MTQANEPNSRIARLEALTLEIAAANPRHDRDITRNDEDFSRINAILESNAIQLRELVAQQNTTQQELTHSIPI